MNRSIFGSIRSNAPGKNAFDLSHERKQSMNMGDLVPILTQEVVPGDSFKVNSEIFMRRSPMIAPMMHRVNCYTHYFFVPNRIIWDEWELFVTGGEDGTEAPVIPRLNLSEANKQYFKKGSLADYMGLPILDQTTTLQTQTTCSALPFRAVQEIFNEYYRDQNLQPAVPFSKGSGSADSDIAELTQLRKRAWEKDYFTSALPFAQRGGEVGIPVDFNYKPTSQVLNTDGSPIGTDDNLSASNGSVPPGGLISNPGGSAKNARIENLEEEGVSVSITELRKSARLQEYLELMARGGSRYIEQLKALFNVTSSDARLQRPEYLGGGKSPVVISEVLSTVSDSNAQDFPPQGTMSGHGISVGKSNTFKKRFEEHGHIIGFMSVLPRTAYQQGINKMWKRYDKFDHYIPQFAHIGEQEIKNEELYYDYQTPSAPLDETFGYQSRYAEYKYKESSVHGDFRDSLNYWHMGRIFDAQPNLNANFVTSDPTQRVFAVTDPDEHKLYVQIYNRIKAIRPMPYYSDPKL